jgi:epoxide hydrolase-like protein
VASSISIADQVHPSRIVYPERDLDDLRDRLERTRWGDELIGAGSDYGVPVAYVRRLANYWLDGYEWRAWEARLNQYGPSETAIDGQRIHFLHVRSSEPQAMPLIMTHGWPGLMISPELGRIDAEHVVGVHVTQLFSFPSGDPEEMKDLGPDELSQLRVLQWFYENKFSFNVSWHSSRRRSDIRSMIRRSDCWRGSRNCLARSSTPTSCSPT